MNNFRVGISPYINSDHSFMTLAAIETLPKNMQEDIRNETGLLVRWFCELPDFYWELFGTLGEWEIDNHFCFDWRRNLKASYFLGCNPVTGRGVRQGHNKVGTSYAVPTLLKNSVQALLNGDLRKGVAYAGAASHFIQDVMTFPEQQSVHRREMSKFEDISIPDYNPTKLFTSLEEIEDAVGIIFDGEPDKLMATSAVKIRECIRSGNISKRREIQLQCDNFAAKMTANILFSVLSFYTPQKKEAVDLIMDFSDVDEERLPDGYFVDRDDSKIFQGYVELEGHLRRGYDKRKTEGFQLRFSATGNSEVRWKQSIIDANIIQKDVEYEFNYSAYNIAATGENGCRLVFYNELWTPCDTLELPVEQSSGCYECVSSFIAPTNAIAVTVDFYSKNNSGTFLVDHWKLRNSQILQKGDIRKKGVKERLILSPSNDFNLVDNSSFKDQNEPIISVIGGSAGKISDNDIFYFDGKSHFIEIPYHPVYQPLCVEDTLIVYLEFLPTDLSKGELMMCASLNAPQKGWRLYLKNNKLFFHLYGNNQEFYYEAEDLNVGNGVWNTLQLELNPKNSFKIVLNETSVTGKAPFSREYSDAGHYIGSDFGVRNFFKGSIKNIQIVG